MNLSKLNIGIIHSLIGKNDGVSIVIDQSILVMQEYLKISINNIFFLSAIAPSRHNTLEDNIFWHKNDENRYILNHYNSLPTKKENRDSFEDFIESKVNYCLKKIIFFVDKYHIDLLIVHNSCHPTNFVYSIGVDRYFSIFKKKNRYFPRYLLWWHDSHLERKRFENPNPIIKKYLNHIPGAFVDGIIFINSYQKKLAEKYFKNIKKDAHTFLRKKSIIIPNTCDIQWEWKKPHQKTAPYPKADPFNIHFFDDIGLTNELQKKNYSLEKTVLFLQHTRIVKRKRIDLAIDFAFKIACCLQEDKVNKAIVLLISGHSGDEDDQYVKFLKKHYKKRQKEHVFLKLPVILNFAEKFILSTKEIIVDKKFYCFKDIPAIVAKYGGIGTYFSEVEGFGNNLFEMVSMGMPVVINEYPIYKKDIKKLGFDFISVKNGVITDTFIKQAYSLIKDPQKAKEMILHNLKTLEKKLNHKVMAKKLCPIIINTLNYL